MRPPTRDEIEHELQLLRSHFPRKRSVIHALRWVLGWEVRSVFFEAIHPVHLEHLPHCTCDHGVRWWQEIPYPCEDCAQ
jgi:hypothetical protein